MLTLFSKSFSKFSTHIKNFSSKTHDLVVIGGGVSGTSILYNCSKLGLNGILLEKDKLTSGTTWHSAGLHWNCRPNFYDIESSINTLNMIKDVEEKTELSCGLIKNGGLYIANNENRLNEYKRMSALSKFYGIENYIITNKSDIKKIHPYLNLDDVLGVLYSPNDGSIDPDSITNALARAAKLNGSIIKENTNIEDILIENNKVIGVKTIDNIIKTKKIVLCTGSWSNSLIKLPIHSFRHAFINTDIIENISRTPNVRDHDLSIYFRVQGNKLAIGGYENNPIQYLPQDNDSFILFDLDYEHFMPLLENHIKRMPILEHVSLTDDICGPESFTPDHKCLIGEHPTIKGLYFNLGHNSMGITNSGLSSSLAKLISNEYSTKDLFHYDIKRYNNYLFNNNKYIRETSWESYAKNYNILFKNDQHVSGRNIIKDELHDTLLKQGAFYITNTSGIEIPYYFNNKVSSNSLIINDDYHIEESYKTQYYKELTKNYTFNYPKNFNIIKNEVLHTRNHTSLINNSSFGKLLVEGIEATEALQYLCTNNINKKNKTVYTLMLNKKATIEADITVSKINDYMFYINTSGLYSNYIKFWINKNIIKYNFDASIKDISQDYSVLSLAGRNSYNILEKIINNKIDLKFSHNKYIFIDNIKIFLVRLSFTGELGYELHIPKEHTLDIYNKIYNIGQQYNLLNVGYAALDSLSAEKFYGHQGEEYTNQYTPIQSNLQFICKKNIEYIGKNIIDEQRQNGVYKKLICISIKDKFLYGNEIIYINDIPSGFIKRSAFSYTTNKSIGFAYINYKNQIITQHFLNNSKFKIKILGDKYNCKYENQPIFDIDNNRIKNQY
jgi:sarcosine dehydrogenase